VDRAARCDDAAVARERRADREVERRAVGVGDATARALDDEAAGRVVPDLLAIVGARRQAQVDRGVVARDRRVLALAVDPERLALDPRSSAIRADSSWSEWPDSTDSQKRAWSARSSFATDTARRARRRSRGSCMRVGSPRTP
jgi:hypothetical protein